ncbi:MAG: hypothetical protein ACRDIU_00460 [Actinomycetota bacterium]
MSRTKRALASGAAALAALAISASVVWACSAQSNITLVPNSGPSHSRSTAKGTLSGIAPNQAPVTLRWGSPQGPELAKIENLATSFSVEFQAPSSPSGVYDVVAVAGDKVIARDAFEIKGVSGSSSSLSNDLWNGMTRASEPGPAEASVVPPEASEAAGLPLAGLVLVGAGAALMAGTILLVSARRRRS